MTDLTARIGDVVIDSLVMNASGPKCVTLEDLEALGASESGAIVTKSMTLLPRNGNPEPRYRDIPLGSINSMGLPNLGYQAYCALLPRLKEFGKPVVASIAGFSLDEYVTMSRAASDAGFDLVELNLSCPNVVGHPQVGYDFEALDAVLGAVKAVCRRPLGCKLPPYFDTVHYEQVAEILQRRQPDFLTLSNAPGNTLAIDAESEMAAIHPRDGFGGLGGYYVKPITLANVWAFHRLLGDGMPIIGVGGIYTGTDAFEYLLAGARAVQIATAYMQQGSGVFGQVANELDGLLARKGYGSAAAAAGQLKPLPALTPAPAV